MKKSVAALLLALLVLPVWAVITAPTTLKSKIVSTPEIFLAKVTAVEASKPAITLVHVEDIKGKTACRKIAAVFTGDEDAEKGNHVPQLLKRVATDQPMVVFYIPRAGKVVNVFTYSNGTWMQLVGRMSDDSAVLRLLHGEPFLRRTFKGTTEEMKKTIVDFLEKKVEPPAIDEKEPAGFGPESPMKQSLRRAPHFFA